jgi:hypothetical protein
VNHLQDTLCIEQEVPTSPLFPTLRTSVRSWLASCVAHAPPVARRGSDSILRLPLIREVNSQLAGRYPNPS